jgi:hypothetical protein
MEIPWDYLYTAARSFLHWADWEFWTATPRKLLACLDEFWFLDKSRAFEAASYNLGFIAVLFSEGAQIPEAPKRKNEPVHMATTNDAGLAILKGLF